MSPNGMHLSQRGKGILAAELAGLINRALNSMIRHKQAKCQFRRQTWLSRDVLSEIRQMKEVVCPVEARPGDMRGMQRCSLPF